MFCGVVYLTKVPRKGATAMMLQCCDSSVSFERVIARSLVLGEVRVLDENRLMEFDYSVRCGHSLPVLHFRVMYE